MSPPPLDRTERLNARVSAEEQAMLKELAEASGQSMSDYLRQLIRREYADLMKSKKR